MGTSYQVGSSANAYGLRYENEQGGTDPASTTAYPGGHSVIFGGATGVGTYGFQQDIVSTPGKIYWMNGSMRQQSSYSATATMRAGLENTALNIGGASMSQNGLAGTTVGKNGFVASVVATGTSIHAYMGIDASASNAINYYADGIRVWEFDPTPNAALVNGNFATTKNLSNWGTLKPSNVTETPFRESIVGQGWIPMGDKFGNNAEYLVDSTGPSGAKAQWIDSSIAIGRTYLLQKVYPGYFGTYSLSASVLQANAAADVRIGIDPTGGLDPLSSSVVWASSIAALNTWTSMSLTGINSYSANGISVWLAGGSSTYSAAGAAKFSNISLTVIPEPGSMLALGSGLVGLFGLTLRRRS